MKNYFQECFNYGFIIVGVIMMSSCLIIKKSESKIPSDKTIKQSVYLLKGVNYSDSTSRKEFKYEGVGLNIYSGKEVKYLKPQKIAWLNAGKKNISGNSPVLRNGKYYISLFQFDTSKLQSIGGFKAKFTFRPVYIERMRPYTISFHRILTPWNNSATWNKPIKSSVDWNGMKADRDYEIKPFTKIIINDPSKEPEEADGFTIPLKKWIDGEWANHGFVAIISGEARQINISKETKFTTNKKKRSRDFSFLGGKFNKKYAITLNLDIVKALILNKSDIIDLSFIINVKDIAGNIKNSKLKFYSINEEWEKSPSLTQLAKKPIISVAINGLKKGYNVISGFTPLLNQWLSGEKKNFGLVMVIESSDKNLPLLKFASPTFRYRNRKKFSKFVLTLKSYPNKQLFTHKLRPTKGIFVKRKGSQFIYGNSRLRLWGVCRHDTGNLFTAERAKRMGFNSLRIWGPGGNPGYKGFYTPESAKKGIIADAIPGSSLDRFDRFFAECKKEGLFIMFPSLHYCPMGESLFAKDSFLAGSDSKDWNEWCKALKECKKNGIKDSFMIYIDERCRKFRFNHAKQVLTHKNKYTGTTYADDEAICIYELDNENGFLQWMLAAGKMKKLPEYFKSKLRKKWCDWLNKKYGTDIEIKKAWKIIDPVAANKRFNSKSNTYIGYTDKEENLKDNSYALAPLPDEIKKYTKSRANDFVQFMVGLVVNYNKELTDYCRSFAPKGIGVNVVPFLSDTQFVKNIAWLYANNYGSDVNSFGIYIFTLSSQLTVPPSMYVLDHLTVKDKPTVIYEINIGRPNPFRGELPYRVSLLAARQDWDGIFWHYFSEPRGHGAKLDEPLTHEEFLVTPQEYPTGAQHSHLGGITDHADPAKFAALAMAGQLFLDGNVPPKKKRTLYSIGPKGYFSYNFIRGLSTLNGAQTFRYGAEIAFDPKQEVPLKIIGPQVKDSIDGNQKYDDGKVNWDWENGRVIVDLPSIKIYAGKPVDKYTFKDGIVLSGINTSFVTFCLMTEDNSPLLEANSKTKMLLSVCYDSQNTGFKMDLSNIPDGGPFIHPNEHGKRIRDFGRAPIVIVPVSFGLSFPKKFNGTLKSYDFALRQVYKHKYVADNTIAFPKGQDFFLNSLSIDSWGRESTPVIVKSEIIIKDKKNIVVSNVKRKRVPFWNPLVDVNWNLNYVWTHQIVRDGSLKFASISKFKTDIRKTKSINITDYCIMAGTRANISVIFNNEQMNRVDIAFTKPPEFKSLVSFLSDRFDLEPFKTKFVTDAFDTSFAEWKLNKNGVTLDVSAKELQGAISISMIIK